MAIAEGKYVLVVEDEEDVRRYLAVILEDAGFEVATAANGESALDLVKERTPDLISLDLVMPKAGGAKFLHSLRRNREWNRIPVLVVTGHAHDEEGRGDLEDILAGRVISGPAVYLEKPVRPNGYVAAVKRQLGLAEDAPIVAAPAEKKDEIEGLLGDADPETLKEVLKLLKEKGSDPISGNPGTPG